jgi:hypothetical protein
MHVVMCKQSYEFTFCCDLCPLIFDHPVMRLTENGKCGSTRLRQEHADDAYFHFVHDNRILVGIKLMTRSGLYSLI